MSVQTPTKPTQQVATQQPAAQTPAKTQEWDKAISFIPFGASEEITLTPRMVYNYIAKPTKDGVKPTFEDVIRFLMLCKSRRLNPFVGDAYLVGYDASGGAQFNLITAHQAFLKRAEMHKEYDGMDSGVLVKDPEGNIVEMLGDFFPEGFGLVGAWATVYFKTRTHPMRKRVKLGTFNKGYSRWKEDPAGMIVKCAEADALRSSFPTEIGGLYIEGELEVEIDRPQATPNVTPAMDQPTVNKLAERIRGTNGNGHGAKPKPLKEIVDPPMQQPAKESPPTQESCEEGGFPSDEPHPILATLQAEFQRVGYSPRSQESTLKQHGVDLAKIDEAKVEALLGVLAKVKDARKPGDGDE